MKDEIKEKCSNCEYSRQCVTMKQINLECCLKDRENEKKDEIKEIFKRMNDLIEHQFDKEYHTECDLFKDIQGLLDYITNLQEENKRLEEIIENLTTMTVCGDRKQIKNTAQYKLDIYKLRCEKAIKCIKDKYYKEEYERKGTFANKLMNILQGEDKE